MFLEQGLGFSWHGPDLCVQKTAFVWLAVYIETGQHET
jgi:hypothetical protein